MDDNKLNQPQAEEQNGTALQQVQQETACEAEQAQPESQKPAATAEDQQWKDARKEEFKTLVWRPWIFPVVALVAICLVTSLLLGLTNMLTEPIISGNAAAAAEAARTALLPEADAFTEMEVPAGTANITAMYKADNGAGYVVEAYGQGYGGKVPAMVAFDAEGTILGVTFLSNEETQGLGTRLVTDAWFAEQFEGLPGETIALTDIDTLANATISSNAALKAINAAIELFNSQVKGGSGSGLEGALENLLPGEELTEIALSADGVQPAAWRSSGGNYIIVGYAESELSTVWAAVAMDENGVILNMWLDTSGEMNGSTLGNDSAYVGSFVGESAPVSVPVAPPDAITKLTGTKTAVNQAVDNALAALAQAKEAV